MSGKAVDDVSALGIATPRIHPSHFRQLLRCISRATSSENPPIFSRRIPLSRSPPGTSAVPSFQPRSWTIILDGFFCKVTVSSDYREQYQQSINHIPRRKERTIERFKTLQRSIIIGIPFYDTQISQKIFYT